jgi:acetyltransferase-like isoleucine patch superfamily enzyme
MSNPSLAIWLAGLSGRLRLWPSCLWRLEARLRGVELQGRVLFQGRPLLSIAAGGRIVLGNGVRIASAVRANVLGLAQPSVLRALAPGAQVILASGVGISGAILCAGKSIEIGEGTILGAGVMVIDNDFHQPCGEWGWNDDAVSNARAIRIGRGVFIGARAIILKGVTIGDRAVIGAGAVVTKDVPPRHLAAGNPAKVLPLHSPDTPAGSNKPDQASRRPK